MDLAQTGPETVQSFSAGRVTFTGTAVVLVALVELLRRAGQHPAIARAKTVARIPTISGGDAVIVLIVLRHYLDRIGANALGVGTVEPDSSAVTKDRRDLA